MNGQKETKETLKLAAMELASALPNTSDCILVDTVKLFAKCSAATSCGTAWIKGGGAAIATASCSGFVIGMLCKLNSVIGLKLTGEEEKEIAKSILSCVLPVSTSALIATTGISFVPVIGTAVALVAMTPVCHNATLTSGVIYLRAITELLKKKGSLDNATVSDIHEMIHPEAYYEH